VTNYSIFFSDDYLDPEKFADDALAGRYNTQYNKDSEYPVTNSICFSEHRNRKIRQFGFYLRDTPDIELFTSQWNRRYENLQVEVKIFHYFEDFGERKLCSEEESKGRFVVLSFSFNPLLANTANIAILVAIAFRLFSSGEFEFASIEALESDENLLENVLKHGVSYAIHCIMEHKIAPIMECYSWLNDLEFVQSAKESFNLQNCRQTTLWKKIKSWRENYERE
jgi:hypothetical protein